ncbi:MAG: hypothetical protein JWO56_593 [Acidobacteria bacterium]|nr:hypothetical protein [Acidobacteriota bacterium]
MQQAAHVLRNGVAALLLMTLTGCPGGQIVDRTVHQTSIRIPNPMRAPAPPALTIITGLRTPESVLWDARQDVYFISNINGAMLTVDGNGFISHVDAKTLAVDRKWIESGRGGVHLDGPKGMAILGDALYVSDITAVRKFDRRTGAPLGDIALPGATFINDLTTDGRSLYASDTGILLGPGTTFIDTGTDAIWKITDDRPEKLATGRGVLRHPNGLDWVGGRLRAVTFGPNELYEISDGTKKRVATLPEGLLDGLVDLPDGSILVSSWQGEGIYRGTAGGDFYPILAGTDAPADLGYDTKRHRLLVPHSSANEVTIHEVR